MVQEKVSVKNAVRVSKRASVRNSVGVSVRDAVRFSERASVRLAMGDAMRV
jgi:hypothetical protein